jgi:hypothetical protein
VIALDSGSAASFVVLDPTWLCSCVVGEIIAPEWLQRDKSRAAQCLLAPQDVEVRVAKHAAQFGATEPGRAIAELLCDLGLCFPCLPPDATVDKTHYLFPALFGRTLQENQTDRLLLDDASTRERIGRRLITRSEHDVIVPGFFPRLQVRMAREPGLLASPDSPQKCMWEHGVLLQRRGVQVLVEQCTLDTANRIAIDVIACAAEGDGANCMRALTETLAMVDVVLEESNPGVLPLEQCVLGGNGLLPAKLDAAERPYARLAEVEKAKSEGARNYLIGGTPHAIGSLLVEAELSGAWAPFERLLRHSPESAEATGDKMETDPKYFVYGSTDEYMQGLTVEGGLTRSMQQEFAQNDEGRWKPEYDYVVEREAIEVPDVPSDDPALLAAATSLEAIGLKGIKRRDQGHESMKLADFCALPNAIEAKLTPAEVAALRLYTGPAYKPMNDALRTKEIGKWATTISLVYSAVLKLSMLSKPTRAYRGVREDEMQIPDSFLDGDFAGGVELGFTSTTTKPDVALKYSGKAKGSIFELEFTMTSRGASIQFLSQCAAAPREAPPRPSREPSDAHSLTNGTPPRLAAGFRTRRSCSSRLGRPSSAPSTRRTAPRSSARSVS